MPYTHLLLQMYADEGGAADFGAAATTAENSSVDGVATGYGEEQIATATGGQPEESWDSLIGKGGRYEKDYKAAVKAAVNKRFKNQQDLQSRINSIDPIVQAIAKKYNIPTNPDGSIPIDKLSNAVLNDDEALQEEAYQRGMSVDTLKEIKQLERENATLKNQTQSAAQQQEWAQIQAEAEAMRDYYPDFDLNSEMMDQQFVSLLATLRNSGFENSVQRAYEVVHHDEIMQGVTQYATQRTKQMVSNAVRSGRNRPTESAAGAAPAAGMRGVDPSRLTDEQMDDIIRRAARGERITFT